LYSLVISIVTLYSYIISKKFVLLTYNAVFLKRIVALSACIFVYVLLKGRGWKILHCVMCSTLRAFYKYVGFFQGVINLFLKTAVLKEKVLVLRKVPYRQKKTLFGSSLCTSSLKLCILKILSFNSCCKECLCLKHLKPIYIYLNVALKYSPCYTTIL
jgi:hypothetical protein